MKLAVVLHPQMLASTRMRTTIAMVAPVKLLGENGTVTATAAVRGMIGARRLS